MSIFDNRILLVSSQKKIKIYIILIKKIFKIVMINIVAFRDNYEKNIISVFLFLIEK